MPQPGRDSARFIAAVLTLIIGCLLVVMWNARTADAATEWTQTDVSTALNSGGHTVPYTGAGLVCLSGHPTGAQLSTMYYNIKNLSGSPQTVYFRIDEWNDSGCTSWNNREFNNTGTIAASAGPTWVASSGGYGGWSTYPSGTATLNASKWYSVATYIAGGMDGILQFYGSSTALGSYGYYLTSDGTVINTDYTTRIASLTPADGTTAGSTSVSISVGYYVNSAANPNGYDTVGYSLYNIDTGYTQAAYATSTITTNTLGAFTQTLTLRSGGAYQLQAFLLNSTNGNETFSGASATGANNLGVSQFAVVSNPLPGMIGTSTLAGTYSLATSTCSIANISGCFQNAIVWALYPSQSSLTAVAQGGAAIKNKPPFGYLFVNIAAIQALNASGTPPVALAASAPITTYIFHPIDVGLGSLMFFFFGVWFFLRVRNIAL